MDGDETASDIESITDESEVDLISSESGTDSDIEVQPL